MSSAEFVDPTAEILNSTYEYDLIDQSLQLSPSHPLFLHPSDHSGISLIDETLVEHNYSSWSCNMTMALSTRNTGNSYWFAQMSQSRV